MVELASPVFVGRNSVYVAVFKGMQLPNAMHDSSRSESKVHVAEACHCARSNRLLFLE